MTNYSISNLFDLVNRFAEQLRSEGFEVETNKVGLGRHLTLGPSYVSLTIMKNGYHLYLEILANGYDSSYAYKIPTSNGWKAARQIIINKIGQTFKS